MSLDVFLVFDGPPRDAKKKVGSGIYVREYGGTREISREEWDRKNPGKEPFILNESSDDSTVYSGNITHNLTEMAKACELYFPLWEPEAIKAKKAADLINPLTKGVEQCNAKKAELLKLNPPNGWGSYETLRDFATEYLLMCKRWPAATIETHR